jgi:small subunit ribosomal protein S16
MAVRIRLKRIGRTHRSVFRLSAMESRSPRDGRVLEDLGAYDPTNKNAAEQLNLKTDRIRHWLSVGAVPTDTAKNLIRKSGIEI